MSKKLDFSVDESITLSEALGLPLTDAPKCPCGGVHAPSEHPAEEAQPTQTPAEGVEPAQEAPPPRPKVHWNGLALRIGFIKKGHKGHPITVVRGVPTAVREEVLRIVKASLGVGGGLMPDEPKAIFLNGDQRDRVKMYAMKKGCKNVL